VKKNKAKLTSLETEAANRAEATAILIRAGYQVYRPEADKSGEDLVIRTPNGELRAVQMKARPTVERRRYGGRHLWMLFPDPKGVIPGRPWFFIEHDEFFEWMEDRHGTTVSWKKRDGEWHCPYMSADLRDFLQPFVLGPTESGTPLSGK
jgi:hypothetical protein